MEINFSAVRKQFGFTLEKVAELSGYSIKTISALEVDNRGSKRLRKKLTEVYGLLDVDYSKAIVMRDAPESLQPSTSFHKVEVDRLKKIADALAEQLMELRSAITDIENKNSS